MTAPEEAPRTAGVIAPPPLLLLGALIVGGLLHVLWVLPWPQFMQLSTWPARIVGWAIIAAALALEVWANGGFRRAGTPVPPWKPSRALVTTGAHAWSRNPMYLGMILVMLGIAVAAQDLWFAVVGSMLWVVLDRGVVAREEPYLQQTFGEQYSAYRQRVRRWL